MKTIKINWFDPDNTDSIVLAAREYGLKIVDKKPTGTVDEIKVKLIGSIDNIATFLEDFEDGDVLPMCSKRDLDDDDYQLWLQQELKNIGM